MTEISREYTIAHNLETTRLNRLLARWPLHITIIPPFHLRESEIPVVRDILHYAASLYDPFEAVFADHEQTFGRPGQTALVREVITGKTQLETIHRELLYYLRHDTSASLINEDYVEDNYRPHVSAVEGVTTPDSTIIDTISLGQKAISLSTGSKRYIVAQAKLMT